MISYYLSVWNSFVASGLLMHEFGHFLILIPSMLFLWKKTRSVKLVSIVFIVGFFMDIDHFLDYWIYKDFVDFNLISFFKLDYFRSNGFGLVIFHGWEYILISYLLFRRKGWNVFGVFWLAMLPHLAWDSISIRNFAFYSFLYRIITGFSLPNL